MKKAEQKLINERVMLACNACDGEEITDAKRLRTCSAIVLETESFYVLQSYSTIIACIDKSTDTLYDFLRYVYGYTATSAQHIAKFERDYGADKWGCHERLTYREV